MEFGQAGSASAGSAVTSQFAGHHLDVLGEGFEALAVGLHDSDREVTRFARVDISDGTGFAFMDAANDLASGAIA